MVMVEDEAEFPMSMGPLVCMISQSANFTTYGKSPLSIILPVSNAIVVDLKKNKESTALSSDPRWLEVYIHFTVFGFFSIGKDGLGRLLTGPSKGGSERSSVYNG